MLLKIIKIGDETIDIGNGVRVLKVETLCVAKSSQVGAGGQSCSCWRLRIKGHKHAKIVQRRIVKLLQYIFLMYSQLWGTSHTIQAW